MNDGQLQEHRSVTRWMEHAAGVEEFEPAIYKVKILYVSDDFDSYHRHTNTHYATVRETEARQVCVLKLKEHSETRDVIDIIDDWVIRHFSETTWYRGCPIAWQLVKIPHDWEDPRATDDWSFIP